MKEFYVILKKILN